MSFDFRVKIKYLYRFQRKDPKARHVSFSEEASLQEYSAGESPQSLRRKTMPTMKKLKQEGQAPNRPCPKRHKPLVYDGSAILKKLNIFTTN